MKKYKLLALALLLFLSCKSDKKNNEISLRFDWTTNMSFSGDIVGSKKYSKEENINIICNQAGEGIDPVKMVISNQDEIGIASLERVLMANEKGADLVVIGFINDVSPTVFLSLENNEFEKPTDFYGKSVGIMPGGSTELVYRAFVEDLKLDKEKIDDIPASFDVKGFINKLYDIKLSFIYVENVILDNLEVQYKMIEPRNFDVNFPGRVYFAKRNWVNKNIGLVQSFINSVIKGWEYSFKNPKLAVDFLKEYDGSIKRNVELQSYEKAEKYFNGYGGEYLTINKEKLPKMLNLLVNSKLIKKIPKEESFLNMSFVDNYYQKINVK